MGSKWKAVTIDSVPKRWEERSSSLQMKDATDKDFIAFYTCKQISQYDTQRKRSFEELRRRRKTITLAGWLTKFDEKGVKSTLKENKDVHWTALSKAANLKNANHLALKNSDQMTTSESVTTAILLLW